MQRNLNAQVGDLYEYKGNSVDMIRMYEVTAAGGLPQFFKVDNTLKYDWSLEGDLTSSLGHSPLDDEYLYRRWNKLI